MIYVPPVYEHVKDMVLAAASELAALLPREGYQFGYELVDPYRSRAAMKLTGDGFVLKKLGAQDWVPITRVEDELVFASAGPLAIAMEGLLWGTFNRREHIYWPTYTDADLCIRPTLSQLHLFLKLRDLTEQLEGAVQSVQGEPPAPSRHALKGLAGPALEAIWKACDFMGRPRPEVPNPGPVVLYPLALKVRGELRDHLKKLSEPT